MYKPFIYLEVAYFPTYLPIYETYFLENWLSRWNPNINSVEVHPQLSNNRHPMDEKWKTLNTRIWIVELEIIGNLGTYHTFCSVFGGHNLVEWSPKRWAFWNGKCSLLQERAFSPTSLFFILYHATFADIMGKIETKFC